MPDTLPRPVFQNPTPDLQWYHLSAGLLAVGLATLADEGLRNTAQNHRSATKDDVAKIFRRMGQPEVYGVVGLGTIAAGIIAGNPRLRRAGERMSAGMLVAAFITTGLKETVGRRRPQSPANAFQFKPFSGRDSWPSGHTTMAFAVATGVADEVHSLPVTIGLYTAASMTGWSRINDDKHWLSDVVMGALVGITSTKLMNGHWRVLGVHAPKFLLEPGAMGLSLRF
jgi:membrane-associated phospholipid phosphatase